MMAGAYRMALNRADLTITYPDGSVEVHKRTTSTVRDGIAKAKVNGSSSLVAEMPVTVMERVSGRKFVLTGADGTTWLVERNCGCGGSR